MFERVISKTTKQNLATLSQTPILEDFYLAGGTGLALQFGHRISIDLDFFSAQEFNPELLVVQLKKIGKFSLESKAEGTLHGILNGTRITFLHYPYPLLFPFHKFGKVNIADYLDIACMKLSAISSRGSKKDFIDLYFICKEIPLEKIFKLFAKKYKEINFNITHIFKSLCYFEQADKEPLPKMFDEVSWIDVKKFFRNEVLKSDFNSFT